MSAENTDLLLTAAVEMGGSMKDVQTSFKQTKQYLESQHITMTIDPKIDGAALKARLREITVEIEAVTAAVKRAEKEMDDLKKAADDAASEIEKSLPGAAKRLEKAFESGIDAVRAEMAMLQKDMEKMATPVGGRNNRASFNAVVPQDPTAVQRAKDVLRGRRQMSQFDSASPDQVAAGMLLRAHKRTQDYKRLKADFESAPEGSSNKPIFERLMRDQYRKAVQAGRDARQFFGGAEQLTTAKKSYSRIIREGDVRPGKPGKVDFTPVEAAVNRYIDSMVAKSSVRENVGGLRGRASALAAAGFSALQSSGGGGRPPGGAPPVAAGGAGGNNPLGPWDLNLNIPYLIDQIKQAFVIEYELKLDKAFLQAQLKAAMAGLTVLPGGVAPHSPLNAADAASAARGAGEFMRRRSGMPNVYRQVGENMPRLGDGYVRLYRGGETGGFTRDRDSAQSAAKKAGAVLGYIDVIKAKAAKWAQGSNPLDPSTVYNVPSELTASGPMSDTAARKMTERKMRQAKRAAMLQGRNFEGSSEFLNSVGAGGMLPLIDAVSGYKRTTPGTPEHDQATAKAVENIDALRKAMLEFENSVASPESKAAFQTWAKEFNKNFTNPLDSKARHVAEIGPNMRSVGALSGVDRINHGMLLDMQAKREAEVQSKIREFSAYDVNFGDSRDRNAEATTAYGKYTQARIGFENEFRRYVSAHTAEDKEALEKRVIAAKQELEFAQETLAVRSLMMQRSKTTNYGGETMSKAAARAAIQRDMQGSLGATFQTVAAGRKDAPLSFGAFQKGLFGGNAGIAKEFLAARGYSADVLNNTKLMNQALDQEVGHLREAWKLEQKIEGEISAQIKMMKIRQQMGAGGGGTTGGFKNTARNMMAAFGGIGIGFTAAAAIKRTMTEYVDYGRQIAEIQGVLKSKSPMEAQSLSHGITSAASKYGVDLLEAAKSAKILAQSGLDATEVVKELDTTFAAARGMGMTIERVQELQMAVRAVTSENERFTAGINYSTAVLDKISAVESRYAVTSEDLASAIQILTPLIDNFTVGMTGLADSFDYTNAMATVMVSKLRITGSQAANVLKMTFSRITRPETLKKLQDDFGLMLGNSENGDYLPLDQMLQQMGEKYNSLKGADKKKFVTELSGGRNTHAITALLEDYVKVQHIATESEQGWQEVQKRSAIVTDTMGTALDRLKVNFQKVTNNMLDSSYAAKGMTSIISGLASVLNGRFGDGQIGLGKMLGLLLGGGGLIMGIKTLYQVLSAMKSGASVMETVFGATSMRLFTMRAAMTGAATAGEGLAAVGGTLAATFGVGTILVAGLLAGIALWGKYKAAQEDAAHGMDKYIVKARSLSELRLDESPQVKEFGARFSGDDARKAKLADNVDTAYQRVFDRSQLIGQASPGFDSTMKATGMDPQSLARMSAIYGEFVATTGKQRDEWIKGNKAKVQEYQRLYAKAFIESLPESAKKGFDAMTTAGEKTTSVIEAVGGAAFVAGRMMQQTISDINASVQQMMTDTMEGLKKIQQLKAEGDLGPNLFDNVQSKYPNFHPTANGAGGVWQVEQARKDQREQIISDLKERTRSLPSLRVLMDNPQMLSIIREKVLNDGLMDTILGADKNGVKGFNYAHIAGLIQSEANRTHEGQMAQTIANLAATNRWKDLGKFDTESLNTYMTPEQRQLMAINTGMELSKDNTMRLTTKMIQGKNPDKTRTVEQYDLLKAYAAGGTPGMLPTKVKGPSDALIEFKNTLLELVLSMRQAIVKMRSNEMFATEFGDAYDKAGAQKDFGKSILEKAMSYREERQNDVVILLDKIENIRSQITRYPNGVKKGADDKERTKLETQLEDRRREMEEFAKSTLGDVLKDSGPEGLAVYKDIREAIAQIHVEGDSAGASIERVMTLIGKAYYLAGKQLEFLNAKAAQASELAHERNVNAAKLTEAALPIYSTTFDKLYARSGIAAAQEQKESAALDLKLKQKKISEDDYKLAKDRLETEYVMNQVYEARMAVITAQQALDAQIMANMQAAMNPIKDLLTNPAALSDVVGWDKSWHDRAEGIRRLFLNTFANIAKSFNDRIFDNIMDTLSKKLMESDSMKAIFGMPESVLSESLLGAQEFQNGILQGAIAGGDYMAMAIAAAAAGKAGPPVPGGVGGAGGAGGAATGIGGKKGMMIVGGGMMIGQMGGTLVGRGGQNAQAGSQIGTTVGMGAAALLGMQWGAAGGPVGMAIGAALGGILGGFLGGKKDKKDEQQDSPVIKGLDAIERAQRETITTIQAQTDALLKPENRLMNLPSNLNVPSYNPGFGGGGTRAVTQQNEIHIEVNVDGGNPADIQRAVEDAVGNVLSDQRRNGTW